MSYFEFPHTRNYDGDLGYIIKRLDELTAKYGEFMEYNQIKFADPVEWNINTVYAAWEIVFANNGYYIAVKPVPAGIMINNSDYWELITPFVVDTALNTESLNPIANKPVTNRFNQVSSSISNVVASLQNEGRQREEADTALDIRIAALEEDTEHLSGALNNERTTRETADTALSRDIDAVNARVDNIAQTIVPGGTSGDAELADIRVGANGVTYANAGDAVRGQFDNTVKCIKYANNGLEILDSENWKIGLLSTTVGNTATVNTAFTNNVACDETLTFDHNIIIEVDTNYRLFVDYVDNSDTIIFVNTLYGSKNIIEIPANTSFRIGLRKEPTAETVTNIFNYIYAVRFYSNVGYSIKKDNDNIAKLNNGFFGSFLWEAGGISSAGNKNSDARCVRTSNAIKFDKDTIIRCNNPLYMFSIYTFSAPVIISDNYMSEYSGNQFGTYVLKANTYYGIIINLRTLANIDNIPLAVSTIDFWSQQYKELKSFNSLLKFAPFGNAKNKIMAHKGCTLNQPENTVPAFEAAALGGVWAIETDINRTSDYKLVCIHDTTLDRTTTGTGNVDAYTLAEIEELNIVGYPNLKVPTLEQYLTICKQYDCVPVLELKNIADEQDMITLLIETLRKFGLETKAIITCSRYSIGYVQNTNPDIRCMFNVASATFDSDIAIAKKYFNTNIAIDVQTGTLTDAMIEAAHNNNMAICVYNVNSKADILGYLGRGVDFVNSDFITSIYD